MKNIILLIALSFLFACPVNMPIFSGKLYQGDSDSVGIIRNNPNEESEYIAASDPQFDKFTCIRTQELIDYLKEVQKALQNCKK
jgi:hypothetical protein